MEGSCRLRCGTLRAAGGFLLGSVWLQSAYEQDVEPLEHGQFEANSGHQRVPAYRTSRPHLVHCRMRTYDWHRPTRALENDACDVYFFFFFVVGNGLFSGGLVD